MGIPPCIPCEGDVTKPDGKGEVNFRLVECLVKGIVYSDIYIGSRGSNCAQNRTFPKM